jgi:hypothetical protein
MPHASLISLFAVVGHFLCLSCVHDQATMITALAFVPRGKAKEVPARDEPSAAELEQLKASAQAAPLAEGEPGGDDDEDDDEDDDDEQEVMDEGSEEGAEAAVRAPPSACAHAGACRQQATHTCTQRLHFARPLQLHRPAHAARGYSTHRAWPDAYMRAALPSHYRAQAAGVQAARARAVAASMDTAKGNGAPASALDAAFQKLDMDKYDDEDDNLISRVLQVPRSA